MKRLLIISLLLPFCTEAQIIITVAGNGYGAVTGHFTGGFSGDHGPATSAELFEPADVVIDDSGNFYIADAQNNRIRKVNTLGIITTIAGTGVTSYNGDGGLADTCDLWGPWGIAADRHGNIYVADDINNRVRKINASGIITTVAGNGVSGFSGDGGPATNAELDCTTRVTFDDYGNLYFNDFVNERIRKVNTFGTITTVAGSETGGVGYSGDGGAATLAQLNRPYGIVVDHIGNIYIADMDNNVVRKVNSSGIISTFAGNGTAGYGGDHGPATTASLNTPVGLAVDSANNIYIADAQNNVIRKVDTSNVITTIVGTGIGGFSGDGGPATSAELYLPVGLIFDSHGSIYIADEMNNRVRKVYYRSATSETTSMYRTEANIVIYPNPTTFSLTISATDKITTLAISNLLGQTMYIHDYNSLQAQVDVANLPAGVYLVKINGTEVRKFVKE